MPSGLIRFDENSWTNEVVDAVDGYLSHYGTDFQGLTLLAAFVLFGKF
jgi:hypothetical protein